jgi:hypothetical protein
MKGREAKGSENAAVRTLGISLAMGHWGERCLNQAAVPVVAAAHAGAWCGRMTRAAVVGGVRNAAID